MKKNMVKLKLNTEVGSYLPLVAEEPFSFYILGMFLTTEMCSKMGFDLFYKWMITPKYNETGGNLMFLEKSGDNAIIYFSDDQEKYEQDPENNSLNIPLEELIKLADKWWELTEIKPLFIIITEENNKYTMEAAQE